MPARRLLLELLAQQPSTRGQALQRALTAHKKRGGSLAAVLLEQGVLDDEQLFALLTVNLGLPGLPGERLDRIRPRAEVLARVPYNVAAAAAAVPLDLDPGRNALSVAMSDPTDLAGLENLQRASGAAEVHAYCSPHDDVLSALARAYSRRRPASSPSMAGPGKGASRPRVKRPVWKRGGHAAGTVQAAGGGESKTDHDAEAKVEIDPALERDIRAMGGVVNTAPRPKPPAKPPRPAGPVQQGAPRARPPTGAGDDSAPTPPLAKASTGPRRFSGRSLLHRAPPEAATSFSTEPTRDLDLDAIELEEDSDDPLAAQVTHAVHPAADVLALPDSGLTPSLEVELTDLTPEVDRGFLVADDTLTRELLTSVGVLVAMLEERIDPSGRSNAVGQVCRLVARELGMDELAAARLTVAGHLLGLDQTLRREMGGGATPDVATAFSLEGAHPGGLGPSLRQLGALVLGLTEPRDLEPPSLSVLRQVARYLDLRAENPPPSHRAIIQKLAQSGGDSTVVNALSRALDSSKRTLIR